MPQQNVLHVVHRNFQTQVAPLKQLLIARRQPDKLVGRKKRNRLLKRRLPQQQARQRPVKLLPDRLRGRPPHVPRPLVKERARQKRVVVLQPQRHTMRKLKRVPQVFAPPARLLRHRRRHANVPNKLKNQNRNVKNAHAKQQKHLHLVDRLVPPVLKVVPLQQHVARPRHRPRVRPLMRLPRQHPPIAVPLLVPNKPAVQKRVLPRRLLVPQQRVQQPVLVHPYKVLPRPLRKQPAHMRRALNKPAVRHPHRIPTQKQQLHDVLLRGDQVWLFKRVVNVVLKVPSHHARRQKRVQNLLNNIVVVKDAGGQRRQPNTKTSV